MKKVLVTGGTVFVSMNVAKYFTGKGYDVYVLNRGSFAQIENVTWIRADRTSLTNELSGYNFDIILDINAYTEDDVRTLLERVEGFKEYVLISSSAVYPETNLMPFTESQSLGLNSFWNEYGTGKISAEQYLLSKVKDAVIIRPPYLCGYGNNIYREAFVFECALSDRPFYLPGNGELKLQFFDVEDLCRFVETVLSKKTAGDISQADYPLIYNVGNPDTISVIDWVKMCYSIVNKTPVFKNVDSSYFIRSYFPFSNYEYVLDISKQQAVMSETKPLKQSLTESYEWYKNNSDKVLTRPYLEFIKNNME
ncbi:MAG: NAD-dependent epimerase/dehydratase family protein [Lachnospiraceae bacterium]|nr:NAD-dependent epimerase/dehydratase family protein [Lachnospiraceae bacterium]